MFGSAAGFGPGYLMHVPRLTVGFSGLKFSLTRAFAGPSRLPVLLSRPCGWADSCRIVGSLMAADRIVD